MPKSLTIWAVLLLLVMSGCVVNTGPFESKIVFYPSSRAVERLPSAFPILDEAELQTEWGKELTLGLAFAGEFDLYRAITCFKRAQFLLKSECNVERNFEVEYHILEAYYFGAKYQEVIETYEGGSLSQVPLSFPPLKELLLMLYDAYLQLDQCEKADRIQCFIQSLDADLAGKTEEYIAVLEADFCELANLSESREPLACFLSSYSASTLSIRKAQLLNTFLPGAGYYYVGQTKTAVTAFIVNTLFTVAAYQFFSRGYIAAGAITTSLEMGWYLGGINGAGLAAKEHNEHRWAYHGKEYLLKERLFPLLMFEYAF